jgi:hypothetical protein
MDDRRTRIDRECGIKGIDQLDMPSLILPDRRAKTSVETTEGVEATVARIHDKRAVPKTRRDHPRAERTVLHTQEPETAAASKPDSQSPLPFGPDERQTELPFATRQLRQSEPDKPPLDHLSAPLRGAFPSSATAAVAGPGGLAGSAESPRAKANTQQAIEPSSTRQSGDSEGSSPDNVISLFPAHDIYDTEQTIVRLAAMPVLSYEQCRIGEAARLGMRVSVLDRAVEAKRPRQADTDRAMVLDDPEPWAAPVTTAEVLDALVVAITRHVILSAETAVAVALWIAHTWVFNRFDHTPRLGITSPTKRCGKSTLLEMLRIMCRRPLKADNISASGVFRTIERLGLASILIDEADTFLPTADQIRGVLNSGFERSGAVIRTEEVRGELRPVRFPTFAPVALAAIGQLPTTLADRAIPVVMQRKAASERVEKLRDGRNRANLVDIARMLSRWAADVWLSTNPAIPTAMGDREGDIAVPLLAVADSAGQEWSGRGRRALLRLFEVQAADEATKEIGVLLLADLRDLFTERDAQWMPSQEIVAVLGRMEDRPWSDWKANKSITKSQLARVLCPFKVKPKLYRLPGGDPLRGYSADSFAAVWGRYLPATSPLTDRTGGTEALHRYNPRETAASSPIPPVTAASCVTSEIAEKPGHRAGCNGVTGATALCGGEGARNEPKDGETEGER